MALVIQTNVDVETQSLQTLACPSFIKTFKWFSKCLSNTAATFVKTSIDHHQLVLITIHPPNYPDWLLYLVYPANAAYHYQMRSTTKIFLCKSTNTIYSTVLAVPPYSSGLMFAAIHTLNNVQIFLLANGSILGSSSSLLDFVLKQLETVREMGEFHFFAENGQLLVDPKKFCD